MPAPEDMKARAARTYNSAADSYDANSFWDRICDPQSLRALFSEADIGACEVEAEMGTHPIDSSEAWWSAVMGSGYRDTVEQLSEWERERVREMNAEWVRRAGATELEANVVYAVARRG